MTSDIITLPVQLAAGRAEQYNILIAPNLLTDANLSRLQTIAQTQTITGATIPVVLDDKLQNHFLLKLLPKIFSDKKLEFFLVKGGEATKSLNQYANLMEKILAIGIERQSLLLAVGGGVVGDLAGFCAASLLRGIRFWQIPTSLLAMVDSSVGGKTGINAKSGKNLIGAFHQPSLVLIDPNFLKTLPNDEISAGLAEIIKYGIIWDKDFFYWLEKNMSALKQLESMALLHAIRRSLEIKSAVVKQDVKEKDLRMLLNFGHTFAHAIEAELQYADKTRGGVLHGAAVGFGMLLASHFSANLGLLSNGFKDSGNSENFCQTLKNLLITAGLPISFADLPKPVTGHWQAKNLIQHMLHDKKVQSGQLTFVLLEQLGKAVIKRDVKIDKLLNFLNKNYL